MQGRWSISRTLPLAIIGLLLVVVSVFVVFSQAELDLVLLDASETELEASVEQVASVLGSSAQEGLAELDGLGQRDAVRQYLAAADSPPDSAAWAALEASAREALRDLSPPSNAAIELWSAEGTPLLSTDGPLALADLVREGIPPPEPGVAPLQTRGDRIYLQLAAEVRGPGGEGDDPGEPLGLVARRQNLEGGSGRQFIAQLIDPSSNLLVANQSGDLWTDLERAVPGPDIPDGWGGQAIRVSRAGGDRLMATAAVPGTPWMVWASTSVQSALAPSRRFVAQFAFVALVLVALGGLVAWLISRSITRPVVQLANASSAIATGDYSSRVKLQRDDEIGLLAASFNTMADEITEAKERLEARVAERTAELEAANREIADAQERLVRRERLATLGKLASGVGHELRNPLGVMTNAVYYLETILGDAPGRVSEYLHILRSQIEVSEKIIHDLLDMSRVQTPSRVPVALHELVCEQIERVEAPSGIRLEHDVPADLPPALIDRTQVGQVVQNLLRNAVQAIPEERTGRVRVSGSLGEDGRLRLEVGDDGEGMGPELLDKIFEPLFTTKARGIGMGLAVSRLLVERNQGELMAESERGRGTTFTLLLETAEGERG